MRSNNEGMSLLKRIAAFPELCSSSCARCRASLHLRCTSCASLCAISVRPCAACVRKGLHELHRCQSPRTSLLPATWRILCVRT